MGGYETNQAKPEPLAKYIYLHDMGRDHSQSWDWNTRLSILEWHHSTRVRINAKLSVRTLSNSNSVPIFFFILFFWVFEIQLLFQIIINRISIIAESRQTIWRLKWGTAFVTTLINIAVFCIFIPAHVDPPLET